VVECVDRLSTAHQGCRLGLQQHRLLLQKNNKGKAQYLKTISCPHLVVVEVCPLSDVALDGWHLLVTLLGVILVIDDLTLLVIILVILRLIC
jgi:hypothetical protein